MVDINSEFLVAKASAQVSGLDGVTHDVMQVPGESAFLGTLGEFMRKVMNQVHTPSAALISGGSAGSVAVAVPAASAVSGIKGLYQGWPFHVMSGGSASPTSLISTASTTVRKVLVAMALSDLPVASSLVHTAPTLQLTYGSAYATSAAAAASGGVSSIFNAVPLPKPSAGEIPVGWINVPNSFTTSDGLATDMLITDYRETQGFDLSAILFVDNTNRV